VLNNLALTELRLGDVDAGIRAARDAVELRPNISILDARPFTPPGPE
jgi:hypothetical protein